MKPLTEIKLEFGALSPIDFFGVENKNLERLKKAFPDLRVTSRGNLLRVQGDEGQTVQFEQVIQDVMEHLKKFKKLTESDIEYFTNGLSTGTPPGHPQGQVIVHGHNGVIVKARTQNQKKLVTTALENDITFAIGPAGTGKTYTAVALAVRALKNKEVKKIILTRPAVEAGESLGFLPGDLKEKIDPYLRPLYDALDDMLPPERLRYFTENRVIEVAPLAYMRGRTLDNAFIILDEAQNTTESQIKMFLTRLGPNAKCIITGDLTQIDLPKNQKSGLKNTLRILDNINGIGMLYLNSSDVIRHRLVKKIIEAFDKEESKSEQKESKPSSRKSSKG